MSSFAFWFVDVVRCEFLNNFSAFSLSHFTSAAGNALIQLSFLCVILYLISPKPLEITAAIELTILENIALFEKNGFKFAIDDTAEPTKKLRLKCIPFTKNTVFGVDGE